MHSAAPVLRFSVAVRRSLVMLCVFGCTQMCAVSDAYSNPIPSTLTQLQTPIQLADLASLREVTGLALAPDGESLAYTVSYTDSVEDKMKTVVWLARRDGSGHDHSSERLVRKRATSNDHHTGQRHCHVP